MSEKRAAVDAELRRCQAEIRSLRTAAPATFLSSLLERQPSTQFHTIISNPGISNLAIPWNYKSDGTERTLTESEVELIDEMKAFNEWKERFAITEDLTRIEIQNIDLFGKRIGFLKFNAYTRRNGKAVPNIVFMRGDSVAVLVILEEEGSGKLFTILTTQQRMTTGTSSFQEIPAGMMDDEGNFAKVAMKELNEETGLTVNERDLIDLTKGKTANKLFLSPGACDEAMKFFLYRPKPLPASKIAVLNKKLTGNLEENEQIKLKIIPFEDILQGCSDAKTVIAMYLYTLYQSQIPSAQHNQLQIPSTQHNPSPIPRAYTTRDISIDRATLLQLRAVLHQYLTQDQNSTAVALQIRSQLNNIITDGPAGKAVRVILEENLNTICGLSDIENLLLQRLFRKLNEPN